MLFKNIFTKMGVILVIGVFIYSGLAFFPAVAFADGAGGIVPCGGTADDPCDMGSTITIVGAFIDFVLLYIAMPLAASMFMYAGFVMMTAGGNPGKIQEAKKIFWSVIIGLVVAFAAWLIVEGIMKGLSVKDEYWLLESS